VPELEVPVPEPVRDVPDPLPAVPLVPEPDEPVPDWLSHPTRLRPATARAADANTTAVFRMRITVLQSGIWVPLGDSRSRFPFASAAVTRGIGRRSVTSPAAGVAPGPQILSQRE